MRRDGDGNWRYVGRRDHMVRSGATAIEPGEIEAAPLLRPDGVAGIAVLVFAGRTRAPRRTLVVFAALAPETRRPSLLDVKRCCAVRLPVT